MWPRASGLAAYLCLSAYRRGADREREVSGYDSDLGDLCVWAMSNSGPAVRLCSEGVLNENSTRKGIYAKNYATSMV